MILGTNNKRLEFLINFYFSTLATVGLDEFAIILKFELAYKTKKTDVFDGEYALLARDAVNIILRSSTLAYLSMTNSI